MGDSFNIVLRNPSKTGDGNFNILLSEETVVRRIFIIS